MRKFRIHPLFIPCGLFFVLTGKGILFLYSIIAVLLHELAHYVAAKNRGFAVSEFKLTPYGAVLSAETGLPDKAAFYVCAAGPLCNLALALLTVSLWWIVPSAYSFTLDFFRANIAIGVFNLLPLYPLDGSRMVLSAVKNKKRCLKLLKILSAAAAAVCLALFVVSAFFKISYSLFLVALILISGIMTDGEKERYRLIFNSAYYLKDCSKPLKKEELCVTPSLKIKKLLRELKNDAIYVVTVLDGNLKIKKVLGDEDLEKMFFFDSEKTVGDFLETAFPDKR